MIKINVKKGETYAVTSSTGCTLTYEKDGQMRILGSAEAGTQVGFVAPAEVVYCDDDTVDVTLFNGALASQAGRGGSSGSGGGLSSAERLMLTGAAQRDAANTFTASNTFTGEVDMSGASVTPPEGWNVGELTAEQVQAVVPIAWDETSVTFGEGSTNSGASSVVLGAGVDCTTNSNVLVGAYSKLSRNDFGQATAIGYGAASGQWAVACGATSRASYNCVGIGFSANAGSDSVAVGSSTTAAHSATAIGHEAAARSANSIAIGVRTNCIANSACSLAFGAQFTETVNGQNVSHTCTTEGTGSITIGAGANTLNNGDTESSNSVTIGCKALNQGADSVVIGAQASGTSAGTVALGAGTNTSSAAGAVAVGNKAKVTRDNGTAVGGNANAGWYGTALGYGSFANNQNCAIGWGTQATAYYATALGSEARAFKDGAVALGPSVTASGNFAVAIGRKATVADEGAFVFRSNASDGTYTQLYFSGANTPLANTYEGGEAMMGYVVRDKSGNVMVDAEGNAMVGTQKLSVLFPNNRGENAFTPAMLSLDEDWTPKPMFHPSDLDMQQEEPSEPEEYQPLPVWPIVEPEIEEMP